MLKGKTVVLGITGSIAAYKSAEIARRLMEEGVTVKTVMTRASTRFISPLTLRTLTNQPVATSLFEERIIHPLYHISLAEEADCILIAPASANFVAKVCHGIADDLLTTIVLAAKGPVLVAPAMNWRMFENPITRENLSRLRERGYRIIGPATGKLAEGEGIGRLADPNDIISAVKEELAKTQNLKGKVVVVTAGGTQERIDDVRFIGNRSSGKMGYALATEAYLRGATAVLISAPTTLPPPTGVEFISVTSAEEMKEAVLKKSKNADAVVMTAAISDFRVTKPIKGKIKRTRGLKSLDLIPTDDILAELGRKRKRGQVLVGFAAEAENLVVNAKAKLKAKNLDLIVANDITRPDIGFGSDYNQVVMIDRSGNVESTERITKKDLARLIIDRIVKLADSSP
jgi:phosphopantothenoylcysteine decarboxylase/phosphopantothenate--cysteine ligase